MSSEVRIFFDERIVTISSVNASDTAVFKGLYFDGTGTLDGLEIESIMKAFKGDVYIKSEDPHAALHYLFRSFKIVPAAGGIVEDHGSLLWIYRLGKWDLPKGKVEEGEELEMAAEREVIEECGAMKLESTGHAGTTYHCYEDGSDMVLKPTHWYGFKAVSGQDQLNPQSEEGITEVKWIPIQSMSEAVESTYSSIRDLLTSRYGTSPS